MDAKELRIGNYVYMQWGKLLKQQQGERSELYQIQNVNLQNAKKYDPIPLTEECLLKLGNAEIKPFAKGIIVFERFIFQWKESYKYWYVMERHSLSYLTKIEFVHEYQNFIFALTGQELTIKKI